MVRTTYLPNAIPALSFAALAVVACVATPIVNSTCVISWDSSADWTIDHYKVELTVDGKAIGNSPYIVKAPVREVACQNTGV